LSGVSTAPKQATNAPRVFSEAEYTADRRSVIDHAAATGIAVVAGADGTPRMVISIPPAESSSDSEI